MTSHADSHDLDKLRRWNDGLVGEQPGEFPIHVLFLVSDEAKSAHDVFRAFRGRFESSGAQFHHIAIFGMHGVTSTVRGLASGLGIDQSTVPALVMFKSFEDREANVVSLDMPSGRFEILLEAALLNSGNFDMPSLFEQCFGDSAITLSNVSVLKVVSTTLEELAGADNLGTS